MVDESSKLVRNKHACYDVCHQRYTNTFSLDPCRFNLALCKHIGGPIGEENF